MTRVFLSLFRVGAIVALFLLLIPRVATAQLISIGTSQFNGGNLNPTEVQTTLSMVGANADGMITTVSFGWSASPCPAAVKIKFFRPVGAQPINPPFAFVTERGPLDVVAPVTSGGSTGISFATQTLRLSPAVAVHAGDLIAITNLSTCGGPVFAFWGLLIPPAANFAFFTVPGDVTSTVTSGTLGPPLRSIFLTGSGSGPALGLLGNRFLATLTARDPRTGGIAEGVPNYLGCCGQSGYFSLPDFTGDPTFPEVTVKMADTRSVPAFGGDFWFFHAPLTDLQYTLTVTDQVTGAVKIYTNSSGSLGQLCGTADTSAFRP